MTIEAIFEGLSMGTDINKRLLIWQQIWLNQILSIQKKVFEGYIPLDVNQPQKRSKTVCVRGRSKGDWALCSLGPFKPESSP